MDTAVFWWGFLFSFIGMGYTMYGRKQRSAVPLACGLCLLIYPYFISGSILMVLIGVVVSSLPFIIRI